MIKYRIKTGDKVENEVARYKRDHYYKPQLDRMRCGCGNGDTTIEFIIGDDGHTKSYVIACCEEFEFRIKKKLGPPT